MARDQAYRKAEQKIEAARRSEAKELSLVGTYNDDTEDDLAGHLTELPQALDQLTQLQSLDLSANRLTALPESLGQLTQLHTLILASNRLTALPESLAQLKSLRKLWLGGNCFKEVPRVVTRLPSLLDLALGGNDFIDLPDWLGKLVNIRVLWMGYFGKGSKLKILPNCVRFLQDLRILAIGHTELNCLPDWIGELDRLEELKLIANRLTDLPVSVVRLKNLKRLDLQENPLNPELAAAYKEGLDAVKRYLRELAKGARNRYEAKLLILGDGNEGKTCVSRALRDLPFRNQKTTHGVDVDQWVFAHPDHVDVKDRKVTLNIWDFEGQEISHQTHQFFLTSQSLYLLVFKCRDLFLMERAEYWLDTIRARAPKAKVAIVITQCEKRSPHVPLDRLLTQYGDLLAKDWFFTVGCESGLNIQKLQSFVQRSAADLEFMGCPWPTSYSKAEAGIKMTARRSAHITRGKLDSIFLKAGVEQENLQAAAAMSRLGAITQFADCPDLKDFIVLRPQWLTKAISKVMENAQLFQNKGEITLNRMEEIWKGQAYRGMFATFHNCMKEFELCYDLEDGSHSCLVPLRFGYIAPVIPWSSEFPVKTRRVEYKLNIRPPMGIMSRFIVKTHHMIVKTSEHPMGIYWHNGVFLRSGEGPFQSEALCEFVPDERRLRIEVRAAYPQNFSEQIHAYIKAVFSFFSGLEAERSYGCIKVDPETQAELLCSGLHTEKRIYSAISKRRILDCEFEGHDIEPEKLIWGFSSFSDFIVARVVPIGQLRQELGREPEWAKPFLRGADSLVQWVSVNGHKIDQLLETQSALSAEFKQETELKLHEYLKLTSKMLDDRDYTAAPGLISIMTKDRSKWNPAAYFTKTYVLTPYCECEGNIHPCDDGLVEFTKDRVWWEKTAPWIARGTKFLVAGLQLAFAGMPLALGSEVFGAIKDDVQLMGELTKHMQLEAGTNEDLPTAEAVIQGDVGKDPSR